jgi:lipopolysaccharide export system permease protein
VTTVDRYVTGTWLRAFGLTLGAMFGLLVVQQVYAELRDLLQLGASGGDILFYYTVSLPAFLPVILPVSLLLSLLFALGTLHRNSEITALRAAGLGIGRITRGLWLSAALLSAGSFALQASVVPWCVEQSRAWRDNLEFQAESRVRAAPQVGLVSNLGFDDAAHRRVWMFNRLSRFTLRGYGVTVSELDPLRREVRRLMAREAFFDPGLGHWILIDGRDLRFDPVLGEAVSAPRFDRLPLANLRTPPSEMILRGKRPRDLSFLEIERVITGAINDPRLPAYLTRYHALLAGALHCLVVTALAVPLAVSGVRTNPAVAASKSVGLFIAYYLAVTLATIAGERGELAPWVAGWGPTTVMLAVAGWLHLRLR